MIEVIIPALRQEPVEWLVASLALGTVKPDIVTVVSNETEPFPNPGVRTRLLRFSSESYSIGDLDVALRQNVGFWAAEADTIVIQGDDQVAPPTMIEDTLTALDGKTYIWGHHRLLDFTNKSLQEILLTHPGVGASREHPEPPAWHGYQSCYGGMFAARTDFIREVGGMDMAFNGRHGNEDQQLGYRLMRRAGDTKVWIIEPPFSWHPVELRDGDTRSRKPWLHPVINGCEPVDHDFTEDFIDGVRFLRCRHCQTQRFSDEQEKLFRDQVLIPYRPETVTTTSVWL